MISAMHWEKSSPSAAGRTRPYQGVRVRDPVKELLRKKRSLELQNPKTAPPTADVVAPNNQSSFTQAIFGNDVGGSSPAEMAASGDGGQQTGGWRAAAPVVTGTGLQPATRAWSLSDYNQQEPTAHALAYPATQALSPDVYMPTLCPSYTMLTYAHTPLLTNFGTIPVAQPPTSLPPMELPDSGLTYLPWAQSLTTISAMPNPAVQFSPGSAALPGSSLVHMPLSMSLTTMIQQLDTQGVSSHPQILEFPQGSVSGLDADTSNQSMSDDPVAELETPNLLDKLLEDRNENDDEKTKDSFSSSIFIPDA